jgi:hypothetical protein
VFGRGLGLAEQQGGDGKPVDVQNLAAQVRARALAYGTLNPRHCIGSLITGMVSVAQSQISQGDADKPAQFTLVEKPHHSGSVLAPTRLNASWARPSA